MNSGLKGIAHTILTIVSLMLPALINQSGWSQLTIGGLIAIAVNWALSHTVATTTGASAKQ